MKGRFLGLLIALQVVNFVVAVIARNPFLPNDHHGFSHPGHENPLKSLKVDTTESEKGMLGIEERKKQVRNERGGVSKIGSSPPICENKCYGCVPCEAIQVPNTSSNKRSHLGIQYTNYEPESWKCKCGPSFYSP
ncbi:hypothetical protein HN51_027225 [Arachis hypogaea]|uniref:Epidermal patterning factor-like protein n=1 Tax=Arachis hypogaea TaxID=3818 RepID=A0A445BNW6_ARAHY|nr:EPIDERMAL PATTERNING FACTOR-like protein 3 [Arachis hypogaea]QHO33543.1 EPIDERMAL PATTERNING FACTOR-like protein [Arachis hypogaea]RYR40367.1 hypothetical protein Ahy_A09g046116 [Arachis hypogaea]